MKTLDTYRASHPAHVGEASEPSWLTGYRQNALASFEERGFPSRKSEAWKYTSLKALQSTPFTHSQQAPSLEVLQSTLAPSLDAMTCELVFVNGVFSAQRSTLADSETLTIQPLQQAITEHPQQVRALLGADEAGEWSEFEALNSRPFSMILLSNAPNGPPI